MNFFLQLNSFLGITVHSLARSVAIYCIVTHIVSPDSRRWAGANQKEIVRFRRLADLLSHRSLSDLHPSATDRDSSTGEGRSSPPSTLRPPNGYSNEGKVEILFVLSVEIYFGDFLFLFYTL